MRSVSRATATAVLLAISFGLAACSNEDVETAGRHVEEARTGSVGQFANRACRTAENALPGARKAFDAARHAALAGYKDRAQAIVDRLLDNYAAHMEFDAKLALRTCRSALG